MVVWVHFIIIPNFIFINFYGDKFDLNSVGQRIYLYIKIKKNSVLKVITCQRCQFFVGVSSCIRHTDYLRHLWHQDYVVKQRLQQCYIVPKFEQTATVPPYTLSIKCCQIATIAEGNLNKLFFSAIGNFWLGYTLYVKQ